VRPLFLTGGRVIDPAAGIDGTYDVLVADDEVAALEPGGTLSPPADRLVIDCAKLWVVPGLIDPHVHLRDPGFPAKETISSGLRAAAAGGFTAVAAMANTSPVNDTPEVARYMLDRARAVDGARLIPVSAVTMGLGGRDLVDAAAMAEAGARLFSDDGIPIDSETVLSSALDRISRLGFAISLHEEDRTLTGRGAMNGGEASKRLGVVGIPVSAEHRRVRRDLAIALGAQARVHVAHISTAEALQILRAAKHHGVEVTCEVTPHHFTLDDSAVLLWGPNARMAPPLRGSDDVAALRQAMADGTIDMIATDHAPHDASSKCMDRLGGFFGHGRPAARLSPEDADALAHCANGVVGLETALGLALRLVHDGVFDPVRMVEMMSIAPARLLRLEDAGTLASGARGDVTIIDPNREWTVDPVNFISQSRNTPFAGMKLKGRALMTIVGGEIVYDGRGAVTL
jgi:dihydroorotase